MQASSNPLSTHPEPLPAVSEPRDSSVGPGRKRDPAWNHVDVGPQGCVWCIKCKQLLQTTGRNHVERIKLHLTKRCAARLSTTLMMDAFRPILKSDTTKQFQEQLAWSIKIVTVTLGGKVVTLVTYCWTDINGKAVVNYCAVCGIYTFLESAYTGTQSHDAAFLTADVERVIAKYDFLEVGAVVTDNTSTNQATWKALQEKFPNSRLRMSRPTPACQRHCQENQMDGRPAKRVQDPGELFQEAS
ncbi:hypothetical protein Pcac1_g2407 [Phytophthora cactorum]|uniref:BED-type domain-containing protein n=2 Tax=Phytophthora cactorum TaxID=29920 RepID=A0A8T0ZR75_9STRA|nr:hypothetical protein Pcac1_g2407 [Phytophthora cactorum]KAG2865153.1 hypothetical protein PC113_g3930 [Phytophthora cactorum]KAG3042334.1 hypothetical protein PC119_g169 [Phytophthora cactorum]KAG3207214.1 hypothetical protein PC128_g215 [Phytophthora cactorum]KAG4064478.1 hypothetical protein PC123_g723 [Phytophthora cactorum]